MPKRRQSFSVRIPPYSRPRNSWRREINRVALAAVKRRSVRYLPSDRLEVRVRFYFDERSVKYHDVDNRLKDVLDALQGRAGGSKARRTLPVIIHNDNQIFRVTVEKEVASVQSRGLGHLHVKKLSHPKSRSSA